MTCTWLRTNEDVEGVYPWTLTTFTLLSKKMGLLRILITGYFFSTIIIACGKSNISDKLESPKKDSAQKPPISFVLPGEVGLDLVYIDASTKPFLMGSNENRNWPDYPAHPVVITKSFYMAKFETTQAQWMALIKGGNPSQFSIAGGRSNTDDLTRPVEGISWNDISRFLTALNELPNRPEGQVFRLPTEAEWEYACRAGTKSAYYFGDDASRLKDYAWYVDNSGQTTHGTNELKTPNSYGLYNMYGNVPEFVQDMDSKYPEDGQLQRDPVVLLGNSVVTRGGGWNSLAGNCNSTDRSSTSPVNPGIDTLHGFRVVLAAPIK